MRLKDKIAIVVGAGQSPGEGVGNGRATAQLFAREGATVACIDLHLERAEETAEAIRAEGNNAIALAADITAEASIKAAVEAVAAECGRIDVLHNNVGVSIAGGDKPLEELSEEDFDRCNAINLRGMIMTCKHVVPVMRAQKSGSIVNISSMAVRSRYPLVVYKTSKAGVVALTEQLAAQLVLRIAEMWTCVSDMSILCVFLVFFFFSSFYWKGYSFFLFLLTSST